MIEETIRTSGKFQVEIKSDYKLEQDQKHTAYAIEAFVFVPNSLDVNPDTYPKYLFYRDTQTYIRFKLPTVLLRDIASAVDSPFVALETALKDLTDHKSDAAIRNCENQIKLFCCILKSSIRDHVDLIANARNSTDAEYLVEHYLPNLETILPRFRSLREMVALPSIDDRIRSIYALADEYISTTVEQFTFDILEKTGKLSDDNPGGYRKALLDIITEEVTYRIEQGYPSIPTADSDNEAFIYRRGVLKRLMESILFLDTSVRPEGRITEQVVYSLAAGLAMVFATTVAFLTQQTYGNFTMAFFVALVVSYMFKDRIKELVRLYVNKKVQSRFFDHKVKICGGSRGNQLGVSREAFQFMSDSKLQPEIRRLRNRDPITRIDNDQLGEKVFLYRKSMTIFSRNFEQVYRNTPIDGITDIWRLGMSRFVRKMDNPDKAVFVVDGDRYYRGAGSKVYHISLVIRYLTSRGELYKRFRIVLNRSGIKRVEEVKAIAGK
ncbi:MAG: hypothetical protein U9R74_04475 [Pseudomonadota bacterium]|nr:hypothetical protein [Pseudomonadota bacterium]